VVGNAIAGASTPEQVRQNVAPTTGISMHRMAGVGRLSDNG
jgi:hypothetical protein